MKYYLPIHLNGDNRGCEAITKATSQILRCLKENIIAYSSNVELDSFLGLDQHVTLKSRKSLSFLFKVERKMKNQFIREQYKRNLITYKYIYSNFLNSISSQDIVLSTGGDMMCYSNNEVIYINEELYKRNVKTVLWGCSIGEKNLTPEKLNTLKHFSLIYARESLTKEMLANYGIKNVCIFPDPAFILEPEQCSLLNLFNNGHVVGVNLSNYVLGGFSLNTSFGKEVISLLEYILNNTDYDILLIPHVLWNGQDDRVILSHIHELYKDNKRIKTLDTSILNYCQIRYVISKCKFFIGSRTHAVISAYSTCVPTLALGYSIKSKGIAKDLGLSDDLVVNCVSSDKKGVLVRSFQYLQENEILIKQHLEKVIPAYKASVLNVRDVMKNI